MSIVNLFLTVKKTHHNKSWTQTAWEFYFQENLGLDGDVDWFTLTCVSPDHQIQSDEMLLNVTVDCNHAKNWDKDSWTYVLGGNDGDMPDKWSSHIDNWWVEEGCYDPKTFEVNYVLEGAEMNYEEVVEEQCACQICDAYYEDSIVDPDEDCECDYCDAFYDVVEKWGDDDIDPDDCDCCSFCCDDEDIDNMPFFSANDIVAMVRDYGAGTIEEQNAFLDFVGIKVANVDWDTANGDIEEIHRLVDQLEDTIVWREQEEAQIELNALLTVLDCLKANINP